MATFYIDPAGTDGAGIAGGIGTPWATLTYACTRVTTSGDIIHVNAGNYTITTQCNLRVGVSIEGVGDTSYFSCRVTDTQLWGTAGYAILLNSYPIVNGNQHISGIKMDGNKLTASTFSGYAAIGVMFRHNVTINNCTFTNFSHWGVRFYGGEPPVNAAAYMTGSSFHDNTMNDCSGFWNNGGPQGVYGNGTSLGCLGVGGLDGMLIYNNTIVQPGTRGLNNEGEPIFGVEGFIKNVKIYNNTITKVLIVTGAWDFAIEIWNWEGGNEIYNNVIQGSVDIVGATTKGTSTYSVWVHDNIIGQPALSTKQSVRGVLFEGVNNDVIIERNYIHHVCQGVYMQTATWGSLTILPQTNITIRYNVMDQIGSLYGTSSGWGFYCSQENGDDPVTNFNFYNNTIIGTTNAWWGISVPDCSISSSNINIKNNIVQGFGYAPVRMNDWSSGNTTVTNLSIQNNIFYGNGNGNLPSFTSGTYYSTGYVNSGNLTTQPPFAGTGNYHLTAARTGLYITSGLTDKDGVAVANPPTIGAYEYGIPVVVVPTVTIDSVGTITNISAIGAGTVTSAGNGTVSARGICWATTASPTIANSYAGSGTGTGSFSVNMTGLTPGTLYYARAYATNAIGTSYSASAITFTTTGGLVLPTVTTSIVTNITDSTAYGGGNVTSEGSTSVTARGIAWATHTSPITSDNSNVESSGLGAFTSSMTGLNSNTTYYVRAYATSSVGTAYGNEIVFVTTNTVILPTVTTTAVTSITTVSATTGGNVTSEGGGTVSERGVVYSTLPMPSITSYQGMYISGQGLGVFTTSLSPLTPGTLYYVRAFATNESGTSYGVQYTFTTLGLVVPTVTTSGVVAITQTTATSGGIVTVDGGSTVTARGVVWSTSPTPTVALSTKTSNGTGIGSFTSSITGLTGNTVYYIRAYATNTTGTGYGSQVIFTSGAVVPTPFISTVSAITTTTVNISAGVSSDGGSSVTVKGVAYGTTPNPTISGSHTSNGTGTTSFSTTLTGLTPDTTYYVRAYATNAIGTSYSPQNTFPTDALTPSYLTIPNRVNHYESIPVSWQTSEGLGYGALYNWNTAAKGTRSSKYGHMYNWLAATDVLGIAASGWHVPTRADYTILRDYLGGQSTAGTSLKSSGEVYWQVGNTGNNASGFNGRGAGYRQPTTGNFNGKRVVGYFWTVDSSDATYAYYALLRSSESTFYSSGYTVEKTCGLSIRLVKDSTDLTEDGQTGTYIGNDGQEYDTICIGTQEWLSENLAETRFVDGSHITRGSTTADWNTYTVNVSLYCHNYEKWTESYDQTFDIAPTGWHLPSNDEYVTLRSYLDPVHLNATTNTAGSAMKETGTSHWLSPNAGATNSSGFTAVGAGFRETSGTFFAWSLKDLCFFWNSNTEWKDYDQYGCTSLNSTYDYFSCSAGGSGTNANRGCSVRLIKDTTSLINGQTSTVTDVDGNVYPTICIGQQEWMAKNIRVRRYNDETVIPLITNPTTWTNNTGDGMCYFDNDINNV